MKKFVRVQRLACLMISSAFPGTPTRALEMLLNITPIDEFIMAKAMRGSYRLSCMGFWPVRNTISPEKNKGHVEYATQIGIFCLWSMPADFLKKLRYGKKF